MTCNTCGGDHQTIRGSIGEKLYTLPVRITELTGQDITADTVTMSVGTRDTPGVWVPVTSPHRLTTGTILAGQFRRDNPQYNLDVADDTVLYWVEGELFIGTGGISDLTTDSDYWPWMKVEDSPQVPFGRGEPFRYS